MRGKDARAGEGRREVAAQRGAGLAPQACPDAELLARFSEGNLAPTELSQLEAHLDVCRECFEVAAALPADEATRWRPEGLETLGRYVLERELGRGRMGIVYAAHDPELDRPLALKLMRWDTSRGATREQAHDLFVREARAAARITHPNVVAVYDFGSAGPLAFIAMELIDGCSLREWLRQGPSCDEVLRVFREAGQGLAAAHAAGWIHRDVKPENVLVGRDGRVRVSDFGLARTAFAPLQGEDSEVPRVAGTPRYMAPEQLDGAPGDAASDQFGFCVALHEALYGRAPFQAQTLADLREAHRQSARVAPRAARVPRWLRAVLRRGLAPEPSRRFSSMATLLAALTPPPRRRAWPWLSLAGVGLAVALLLQVFAPRPAVAPANDGSLHLTLLGPLDEPRVRLVADGTLELDLWVSDVAIRRRVSPFFDGHERVFALLPTADPAVWKRVDLAYQFPPAGERPERDWHHAQLTGEDIAGVTRRGVAFGLDTNIGTFWLQAPDDNWLPRPRTAPR